MKLGTFGARTRSKIRRHHNTKGYRQIRRGKTVDQVRAMARRLGIPYVPKMQRPSIEARSINLSDDGLQP